MAGCSGAIALAAILEIMAAAPPSQIEQQQVAKPESSSPAYPPAMGGPDILPPVMPTAAESRKRFLDSADLHAAVSKITTQSPTIDKLAASEALLACADFRPRRQRDKEEQSAAQELAERCAGIRQSMRRNGAINRAVELLASAEEDPSPLGRLAALARRSDAGKARWHAAELALVSEALRSNDPVLITEAIRALRAQLDNGLIDSKLRSLAFAQAADLYALHRQRTVFDALVDCANLGRCANESDEVPTQYAGVAGGVRERSEVARLAARYRLALQRGTTTAELLAIR